MWVPHVAAGLPAGRVGEFRGPRSAPCGILVRRDQELVSDRVLGRFFVRSAARVRLEGLDPQVTCDDDELIDRMLDGEPPRPPEEAAQRAPYEQLFARIRTYPRPTGARGLAGSAGGALGRGSAPEATAPGSADRRSCGRGAGRRLTATIVSLDQTDDWDSALLETLRRVPGEWHHLVRGCFDSAASRAQQLADGFRDRVRVGTRLAPPPPPVAP